MNLKLFQNKNFTLFHFKHKKAILLWLIKTCTDTYSNKIRTEKELPPTDLCELTYEINREKYWRENMQAE